MKPAHFGMHPQLGVMVTFGHGSNGIDVGDWGLAGTVLASGPDMTPGPYPTAKQYPINQVRKDDRDTADLVSPLLPSNDNKRKADRP